MRWCAVVISVVAAFVLHDSAYATIWYLEEGDPPSTRDYTEFYLCTQTKTGSAEWTENECRRLDMMNAEGKSTIFGGSVTANVGDPYRYMRQTIVFPRDNYLGSQQSITFVEFQCTVTLFEGSTTSPAREARWLWNGPSSSQNFGTTGDPVARSGGGATSNYDFAQISTITWLGTGSSPLWQFEPDDLGAVYIEVQVLHASGSGTLEADWTCQITNATGHVWVPVVTPTPTSSGWDVGSDWGSNPWGGGYTPTSWIPATPDPISFGVTVSDTECIQFLPGFDSPSAGVYSYTVEVDIDAYEICGESYSFDLEFMGWDLGVFMSAIAAVGAFGILYGIFKRG